MRCYREILHHQQFLESYTELSEPIRCRDLWSLRPRPHVSGDFCIRKFFYADTKISVSTHSVYESYTTVHAYPIRIRTSQRISQQSMRITKKAEPAIIFWYCDVSVYKNILIRASTRIRMHSVYRNFHAGDRIQKSPDTPSVYGGHAWTLGVSA